MRAEPTAEATLRDALPTVGALTFPVPGTDAEDREEAGGSRVEPLLGAPAVLSGAVILTATITTVAVVVHDPGAELTVGR